MPASLAEGRQLLAVDVPLARRKQLGQCFTGLRTGRLLAALAVRAGQGSIVDPMAGHGDLLESAAERASRLNLTRTELLGVEIEPEAARLGEWRVERCAIEFCFKESRFIHGDAFSLENWSNLHRFDLVITNPPYVRYQTLSNGAKVGDVKLLNSKAIRNALERIANALAPAEEQMIWRRLIRSYSGLADLSLPSWLLCGLLTAPSGVLALVVPQTWLNRDYARLARYFFLRFFQPLAIVHESGQRWFRDALVPVSLVVGRRLPFSESLVPLQARSGVTFDTPFVEVSPRAASDYSHVGKTFAGNDPEGDFACWLEHGRGARLGVKLKRVSWEAQRDEVLAGSHRAEWLRRLEGEISSSSVSLSASLQTTLPVSIGHAIPTAFLRNASPLSSQSICIGQGLRTGCNAFFYVDVAEEANDEDSIFVLTSELFGKRRMKIPASVLKPVLRKQAELSGMVITPDALRGRLLDLRGLVLPENVGRNGLASRDRYSVMPKSLAAFVRMAAHTQLVRGPTRTLIPNLSAVKPNGLGPSELIQPQMLLVDGVVRMWYMVPDFAPRHLPSVCVPRIIHNEPRAMLNSEPPVLIDANFSTLWAEGDAWCPELIFAVLNSTWGELCMEALGASLGGGALKLEATHLRQVPVPKFSRPAKESLRSLVKEAIELRRTAVEFQYYRTKIDRAIVSALAARELSAREAKDTVEKLSKLIRSLRAKRRRNHGHKTMEKE